VADSADVAASLKRLGYTVIDGKELNYPTRGELTGAVERFADAGANSDTPSHTAILKFT
jgi:hypothetical protein